MNGKTLSSLVCALLGSTALTATAMATGALPGAADAGRIQPEHRIIVPDRSKDQQVTVPNVLPSAPIPQGANTIHLVLKGVDIEGMTAFTPKAMSDTYVAYIGKDVTLDIAWLIAGKITERYRNAGYFLSRAFVPQQHIKNGHITIRVAEGSIGKVDIPGKLQQYHVVRAYIARLVAQKPVTAQAVESFLLRLNDLPGYSFRAVLSPMTAEEASKAEVKLTLVPSPKAGKGSISLDNFSSRYLGPGEISGNYSTSLLPLQQTTISGLGGLPVDKLRYGTIDHTILIAPDMTLELNGGVTKAYPGYTLKSEDIDSLAVSESISLNYQLIRQRQQNLSFKFTLDSHDIRTDLLHTPLTRDHIRALRAGASYDMSDNWAGYNIASVTLSHGIKGLGATLKGDPDASRAGALPNFTKLEMSLSRLQGITQNWSLFAAASSQLASGVLFSSEQFGYGGQAFGRAYDTSDITGDDGMSGALELRYSKWAELQPLGVQPYTFYDIGTVWNGAVGQPKRQSGASAGFGLRLSTVWGETGNVGLAWPLTRDITAPLYNGGHKGPRILLQISQSF